MNYIDKVLEGVQKDLNNGKFYLICSTENTFKEYLKQSLLTLQEQHEAEIKNKKYKEMLIEYMNDMHAIDENDALQQLAYEKGRHIAGEQHKKEIEGVISYIAFNEGWEETEDKYRKHFGFKPKYEIN